MPEITRRSLFGIAAGFTALSKLHAAVKPVRITGVDVFPITIPITPAKRPPDT